jgi:hypothetical protein
MVEALMLLKDLKWKHWSGPLADETWNVCRLNNGITIYHNTVGHYFNIYPGNAHHNLYHLSAVEAQCILYQATLEGNVGIIPQLQLLDDGRTEEA